ncbi:DUF4350 domain-containing protein [Thiothrix fructosivorans]|uniref:DUF4350 domain-containing protein n=1 Tax=Thiothrix fructosivorans TaxID=111770 RepID=A0A8B0SJJ6_9GAMM|nr:DUF4350 domain-containing protein [Thiothrix fructosivorans]MBO0613878.1 DUF4350 domain-containing protein [Thiothrix fructosivorans]QTX10248.1 DUF4350 domain-containing protein [Thiothrix fructosivorans]
MKLQPILIVLLIALVLTTGTFWFLKTYEYKAVDEYVGLRGEANSNPLFAARLFLQRMGIPAERKDNLQTLPPLDTVLLLDMPDNSLSRQKMDNILAWVERGGHLITHPATIQQDADLIPNNEELRTIKRGKGLMTLVANLDRIENTAIGDEARANAKFLWQLVHKHHAVPAGVWLIHQDAMPPLWQLIWKHAWALVLTLALLLPLTLLALSPRFGPLIPQPAPGRRRILEHIHASGLFMWQRHRKHGDTQYHDFIAAAEQLTKSTRTQHDNTHPDA